MIKEKKGFQIYHIERIVKETGDLFGDEEHIIYVNSQIKDETSLGKLMHDFSCIDAKDMYYQVLADRVRYFKEDEKGVTFMCKVMEDMRNEARAEGRVEGRAEGRVEGRAEGRAEGRVEGSKEKAIIVARKMLNAGKFSYEEISEFTSLTLDEIKTLATKQPA